MYRIRIIVGCFGAWAVLMGVAIAQQPPAKEGTPSPVVRLKKIQLGTMQPASVYGDIYLGGQPSPEDLALLKAQGVKTIINLRLAKELTWDEAVAVDQAGMRYVHVPFQSPHQLKPAIFEKVLSTLRDKRRVPVVLHCASANRVGAIWYAYRVLDGGVTFDEARKEAQQVGLRTPAYLEKAQAYVEAVQAEKELKKLPVVKPN